MSVSSSSGSKGTRFFLLCMFVEMNENGVILVVFLPIYINQPTFCQTLAALNYKTFLNLLASEGVAIPFVPCQQFLKSISGKGTCFKITVYIHGSCKFSSTQHIANSFFIEQ